jgi:formylglycine-generating enzyme required for sulfatase activity
VKKDHADSRRDDLPGQVQVDLRDGVKMDFVLIPAGAFTMGSPKDEAGRDNDEGEHDVTIGKPFYLGKYLVTQQEYETVMGDNPSAFCANGKARDQVRGLDTHRFPVEDVSWDDAMKFCERLTAREAGQGRSFRLPTEAEWEYACRSNTRTPFYFGKELNGQQANCKGEDPYGTPVKGPYLRRPTNVGAYAADYPHPWGLCDMHGNVWQWCADWYGAYEGGKVANPTGPATGTSRVLRGGSWDDPGRVCRAAFRGKNVPGDRVRNGFRVVLVGSAKAP